MTDEDALVEKLARVLCEQHIRTVRRWDTPAEKLERMLPDAVDYGWLYHCHEALAILPIVNARLDAVEKERDALRGAISWIEPPFVDGNTSKKEMRQRIAFAVADAERAQTLGGNHEG